jgi:hypothetical protein
MRPQLVLAALTSLVSASCYSAGDGQAPPLDQLYFPTGLALDGAAGDPHEYLYVASSDFDLQYRSSNLISFDLDAIQKAVPRTCSTTDDCDTATERCDTLEEAAKVSGIPVNYVPSYVCVPSAATQPCSSDTGGEQSAADRLLYPGRCKAFDQHKFIHSTVGIGAFATDVIFAEAPPPLSGDPPPPFTKRLFLPVRGDATLHWIDLDDGNLLCDQSSTSDGSCGDSHRAGHDPSANNNNFSQPSEPFGIAVSDDGAYVAMTNQTSGSVSLYTHNWNEDTNPQLVSVLGGLPQAPVAIAAVPQALDPKFDAFAPSQGFLVAYRNAAQIDLLRVRDDYLDNDPLADDSGRSNFSRYALTYAGSSGITVNSLGYDSRDIVIDDSQRKDECAKLARGTQEYRDCVRQAPQPDVYVANRAPSSLLVGSMTADFSYASGSSDLPAFTDSFPLTTGPSRLVLGKVRVPAKDPSAGKDAFELEPRVFIVCFDSTRIFVYDPTRHAIDTIIDTGRGPYAMAVDEQRGLAYVGFFTDSYLGVVSLDQRHRQTYATVIANIGNPTAPRSSK